MCILSLFLFFRFPPIPDPRSPDAEKQMLKEIKFDLDLALWSLVKSYADGKQGTIYPDTVGAKRVVRGCSRVYATP